MKSCFLWVCAFREGEGLGLSSLLVWRLRPAAVAKSLKESDWNWGQTSLVSLRQSYLKNQRPEAAQKNPKISSNWRFKWTCSFRTSCASNFEHFDSDFQAEISLWLQDWGCFYALKTICGLFSWKHVKVTATSNS